MENCLQSGLDIIPYRVGQDIEILTVMHAHQRWPSVL
ncbi:type II toxin-antitoxin system RelE/ParE family toxin [Agrobacterium sp. ICMP 7243]|nr:type II toxin-antitoxin system RelE/ParE family toxin [Agrobacterium sp. ICMP 7243]